MTAVGVPRLTEADLFEIWRGQRFPEGALITRAGVPLRVVSAGRVGRGPGPDFRNAGIAVPSGAVLRGDVELHVRTSMFRAHGHAVDPAYGNVILHVVFEDDDARDTLLPGGKIAPVVALAGWVARREEDLRRWLDRPLLWREPCHDACARLGRAGVNRALDGEGDGRMQASVERWRGRIAEQGIDDAVYAGVLGALGFGGNAAAMEALAQAAPWHSLRARSADADNLTGVLLGVAGLLPSQRGLARPQDAAVAAMEQAFARSGFIPGTMAWKLWGVRPQNHPARRIAAAGALLAGRSSLADLLDAATLSASAAIAALSVPAWGYWIDHHDVGAPPCRLPAALIGRSRAIEILINCVLPAAIAEGAGRGLRARELYEKLPRPAVYGRTRFLEEALAAGPGRHRINALRAQGLLALHNDWCTKDGCGRCPLS